VKLGGSAMLDPQSMQRILKDIVLLHYCNIRLIIVHGGGPEISMLCDKLNVTKKFVNGLRVTDSETLEIVQMALLGKNNRILVTELNQLGAKAVGISGNDAAFLKVKKLSSPENIDLGFVGEIHTINTYLMNTLFSDNFLPVVAPVGVDMQGQVYNINADSCAGAIAASMKVEKLIILTDVNGFYENEKNPDTRLPAIHAETAKRWLQEKRIVGGMIPKLQACVDALEQGVSTAHLLDGNMPHSILLEIFTDQGVGTLIQRT
jgi:acetylglutamate kinase